MRSVPFRAWVFAAISALLQVLPFPIAGPVPLWRRAFCWFCLTPLLFALLDADAQKRPLRPKQAALLGYLCGVLWYLGNCYWIYQTMHLYGGIPEAGAFGILFLFSLYLGLYHALFGWIVGLLRGKFSREMVLCLAPFIWVAVELARARITGFPWDLLGYTQVDHLLLTQIVPLTGVMGLSLWIAIVNVLWLLRPRSGAKSLRYSPPGLAGLLVAGFLITGPVFARNTPPETAPDHAVLLQDNLNVGSERTATNETREQMLQSFAGWSLHPLIETRANPLAYSRAPKDFHPDLIAWPEAPTNFISADPGFRSSAGDVARRAGAPLISDSVSAGAAPGAQEKEYVSASFFDATGAYVGRYDKMHLVPFGEYVPYKQVFFFAGHLLDGLDFSPGAKRELFHSNGHRFGTFICYESIFGDEVRQFAADGAQVLVNLSDDGWYGDTSAPWEHLDMARMRAIESRRWLLRATNTGVTTAIDPYGRETEQLPRHQRAALAVAFGFRNDVTFYTRHGDWFAWLCVAVTLGALGYGFAQRRQVH